MDTADPTLTIVLAIIGALGLIVGPVAVALINRGGKSSVPPAVGPDRMMPRSEYDGLLDQMTRLDDECDRLVRENARLREALEVERREHAAEVARLTAPDRLRGKR